METSPRGWDDISREFEYATPDVPEPQNWGIPEMDQSTPQGWAQTLNPIEGWEQMSPDERGDYVYFSGLKGEDYLTDSDWARMSPDIRQRIGYTDSRIDGGLGWKEFIPRAGEMALETSEGIWNQPAQIGMDAIYDPIQSVIDKESLALLPGLISANPGAWGALAKDIFENREELEAPLNDTIENIQNSDGIAGFAVDQNRDYKERPLAEQFLGQVFAPGGGLYKGVKGLGLIDDIADTAQGGKLLGPALGALADIPGVKGAVTQYAIPGVVGAGAGALTDAVFDPEFSYVDPVTGETKQYDPGIVESALGGAAFAVTGRAATRSKTVPLGAGLEEVSGFILPRSLAGAKPGFTIGSKAFKLNFEDALDRALFIVRNGKEKSRSDEKYMDALRDYFPDLDDRAIRAKGDEVYNAIKGMAKQADKAASGEQLLKVPVIENVAFAPELPVAREIDELSTVPPSAFDEEAPGWEPLTEGTEDALEEAPAERLIRQQQELFATDPEAAAPFLRGANLLEPGAPAALQPEVPAPPATPVDQRVTSIVEEIDAHRELNAVTDQKERVRIWRARQAEARAQAMADARKQGLPDRDIAAAGNDAIRDLNLDNPLGPLNASDEEIEAVSKLVNEKVAAGQIRQGEAAMVSRVLRTWKDGKQPSPSELTGIRRIITGSDGPPLTPRLADVVEPGMEKPIMETLEEVADAPLTPADAPIIGADDALFPDPPEPATRPAKKPRATKPPVSPDVPPVADEVVERVPRDPNAPLRVRKPIWEGIDDVETVADEVTEEVVPAVREKDPVLQAVSDWEKEMTEQGLTEDPEKFKEVLEDSFAELVARLGPDAVSPAKFSKQRIPTAIARRLANDTQAKTTKELTDAVKEWHRLNEPEFNAIKVDEDSSWASRFVGGALKNKLADTLTMRGRDLSQYFQRQGFDFKKSQEMTEAVLAQYLNKRMIDEAKAGNKNAILEHALTALHMGEFSPTMKYTKPKAPKNVGDVANWIEEAPPGSGGDAPRGPRNPKRTAGDADEVFTVEVPKGTGDVAGWIEGARTVNAAFKNMFFGIADVGALMANAVPAVAVQGPQIITGYLNRVLNAMGTGIDLSDIKKYGEFSGLAMDQSQDVLNDEVGTLLGAGGRFIEGMGAKKVGGAMNAIDQNTAVRLNKILEKAQFDLLMNKGLRQPAFEGNLVLLKLLGRDINDPKVLRAAARMANAATSTAPLARGNTRRAAEGATLGSARYLRAQGDLLLAATKLINPRASMDERIIAATAIAGILATTYAAKELAGERLNLDPTDLDNFGKLTLADGTVIPFFQQKQLAMTVAKTVANIDDAIKEGGPTAITDPWARFLLGRVGPLGGTVAKGIGIGYDPMADAYNYPGQGPGYGSEMSPTQKALHMIPIPVGITGFFDSGEATELSRGINFAGAGSYPRGELAIALEEAGYESFDEMEAENPKTYMSRKADFFKKNPDLRDEDSAITGYQDLKKKSSEAFMTSATPQTVKDWRDRTKKYAANMEGAYNEMGIEDTERPKENGSRQWIYDYNQTFAESKEDPENDLSDLDFEVLGRKQAEFWDKHTSPSVRKEVLAYQIAKADTEADKLWARDMARLSGFDPDTGKRLTYPGTDTTLPNYFEMDRKLWREVPNDESREFHAEFDHWKEGLSDKVKELSTDKLIDLYIETEPEASTRLNGKPWTPVALADVKNYVKTSKEDPIFSEYKEIMRPELLWFKPKTHWDTIKDAHEGRD